MSTCEIRIVDGIPTVKTYPKLMREILTYTKFNIDQSMDLYGVTLLPEFQDMNISNPSLKNILSFVEQDQILEAGKLNKTDKQLLLDMSLVKQPDTEIDIKDKFLETFTNSEGMFEMNTDKIKSSNLFSESDILNLEDNVRTIRDLYYKLNNNTLPEILPIQTDVIINTGIEFNKENPDVFLDNNLKNYSGLESISQIQEKAREIGDETLLNNPSLFGVVLQQVQDKQNLVQYETDEYGTDINLKTTNNPKIELEQTLDLYQDFSELLSKVQLLRELNPQIYRNNPEIILEHIQDIEEISKDLGLNLNGLSQIMYSKSQSQIVDFADNLYNFLADAQTSNSEIESSMQEYVDEYLNFFEVVPENITKTVPKIESKGLFLHLETNLSEENIFVEKGLLKVGKNIYQKISDTKSLEELYNLLFQNSALLPPKTISVAIKESNRDMILEDIDKYVSNQAREYLTEQSDIKAIKKMVVYKILTNNTYKSTESKVYNGKMNLNPNTFLINFNKYLLKNPEIKSMFYISNRGLEAKGILGEYSTRQLQNELPQATFEDLVEYSKLSGNESLDYLTTFENDFKPARNLRDFYANNLEQLPVYNLEYSEKDGYILTDSTSDFLRIRNELYENVAPNIYARVERDKRYINSGLTKPEYNNSIKEVKLKNSKENKISVKKVTDINNNEIEFC